MVPTLIVFGLLFGRWWRATIIAAAVGWPVLLVVTAVMDVSVALFAAMGVAVLNAGAGVLVHQGLVWSLARLRGAGRPQM